MSRKVDPSEDTGADVDPSEDTGLESNVDPSEGNVDPSEGEVDPSEKPIGGGGLRASAQEGGQGGGGHQGGGHGGGRPESAGKGINPVQHSE
jgi:hypothetical protein